MQHKIFYLVQKLINRVLKRFVGLRDLEHYTARQKAIQALKRLSFAHAFNYIVLRINPGPTSCEDIATEMVYHTIIYMFVVEGSSL